MIIDLWPLTIKLDVLLVQVINIIILFYLFKKLFGTTLINEVAKRREQTIKLQQAQQEYDAMLQKAQLEKDEIIAWAMEHKQHILAEWVLIAQKEKDRIISWARGEAENIMEKAKSEIASLSKDLQENWIHWVTTTASALLKKIIKKDVWLQKDYVETLLEDIKK